MEPKFDAEYIELKLFYSTTIITMKDHNYCLVSNVCLCYIQALSLPSILFLNFYLHFKLRSSSILSFLTNSLTKIIFTTYVDMQFNQK